MKKITLWPKFRLYLISGLLVYFLVNNQVLAQYSQWGNLQPGPYAVGYQTIRTADYSRSYFTAGRPLQLYVWYPAAKNQASPYMQFADYFEDMAYDWGDEPKKVAYLRQTFLRDFRTGTLNPSFPGGVSEEQFQKIIHTTIPVVKQALPAEGKFPVLLHSGSNGVIHQSIMMEYLASHGYTVISISMYSSSPAFYGRGEDGNNALLQLTEDVAFALAQARSLPYADCQKAAMIGMMAQAGLSLQFKEMPLAAIACLDCSWNIQGMKQLPYFDTRKIRIPIIELINTDFFDQKLTPLDSLPYAQRYIGRFRQLAHADFYPFPKLAQPQLSGQYQNYEKILMATLQFLNATLKDDSQGKAFLTNPTDVSGWPKNFLTIRKAEARKAIPTENEFLTWIRYGELEKARAAWQMVGKNVASQNNLFFVTLFLIRDNEPHAQEALQMYVSAYPNDPRREMLFNQMGYLYLRQKQYQKALELYTLFAKQFPASPYAYDGLADVYAAMQDKQKAKTNANKVLELLNRTQLPAQEKESLRRSAQEKIDLL